MRLNRQAHQERQDQIQPLLFLAFLASLVVQSLLRPFRAAAIKRVFGSDSRLSLQQPDEVFICRKTRPRRSAILPGGLVSET
jgi:hypothetical protein